MDAVVRGRADVENLPTFGDEAEKPERDAESAETRPGRHRREHGLLQQDVQQACQSGHPPDSLDKSGHLWVLNLWDLGFLSYQV